MEISSNVPVYTQSLPPGTIFYNNTTGPNLGDAKAVPANPYDGVIWKIKYNGIK